MTKHDHTGLSYHSTCYSSIQEHNIENGTACWQRSNFVLLKHFILNYEIYVILIIHIILVEYIQLNVSKYFLHLLWLSFSRKSFSIIFFSSSNNLLSVNERMYWLIGLIYVRNILSLMFQMMCLVNVLFHFVSFNII